MCLFGEHQDYFGLSVIAAAVDLRIAIAGTPRPDDRIVVDMPDMGEREELTAAAVTPYAKPRDYLRSAVNIHRRAGLPLHGWDCRITSTIPINAGTSSSSALVVAWNKFLLEAAGDPRAADAKALAELGFDTEVAEFGEPGGKMDHYASAFGGVIWIRFDQPLAFDRLRQPLGPFVLANSLQKKDTTGMLGFIKSRTLAGAARVAERLSGFGLKSPLTPPVRAAIEGLPEDEGRLLLGTLLTRDLTRQGAELFRSPAFDHVRFGAMLSAQHAVLRDHLRISTDKIEAMIASALDAGALGAKINGSGGGGCMFAYAPERPDRVAAAVAEAGGRPVIVRVDEGARRES
jgi:galactokinase